MKRLLVILFVSLCCAVAKAQYYGPIECNWELDNVVSVMVRWDEPEPPAIWGEYPDAHHIRFVVSGGWKLEVDDKVLEPEFIIFNNDNPSVYDALELSYNWYEKHKTDGRYCHRDFTVVLKK